MADNTILAQWQSEGEERFGNAVRYIQAQMLQAERVAIGLGEAFAKEEKEIEQVITKIFGLTNATKIFNQYQSMIQKEIEESNREMSRQDAEMLKAKESAEKLAQSYRNIALAQQQISNANITKSGGFDWLTGQTSNKSAAESAKAFKDSFRQMDTEARKATQGVAALQRATAQLDASALGRFSVQMAGSVEKLKQFEAGAYEASRQSQLFSQQLVTHPIQTLKAFTASTEKAAIASQYFKEQLAFIAASRFGTILIWGSILAGIAAGFKAVADASIEMDSAIHRVASAFVDESNAAINYGEIQKRIAISSVAFGKSFKEVSEVMWELKSAGLSVTETYAAMDPAMQLVLAGAENINQSTRLLAGLYKQFGNEIKGATTEQEKFAGIAGTIAYANIKSQATIDTLMQSYKYAAGVAKATGVSFNELTAAIAVANNAMLFGSTAGTGLAQELLEVAKNYKKIASELGIALDPTKPLQFTEFLHKMAEQSDLVTKRLDAMADVSEVFNVRALRALLAQVDALKEYDAILKGLTEGSMEDRLKEISDRRLASFENQWKRMKQAWASNTEQSEAVSWLGKLLKYTNDEDEAIRRLTAANQALGHSWIMARAITADQMQNLKAQSKDMDEVLKKAKQLEQQGYAKAAKSGNVDAAMKLAESKKYIPPEAKDFKSMLGVLDSEKAYRYELLLNNKTLDEQIAKMKERVRIDEENALHANNQNKDSKEADKLAEKALQSRQQLVTLLERQKQHEEKIRQDEEAQRTVLLDVVDSVEKVRQKMMSIKDQDLTPFQEMQNHVRSLQVANNLLIQSGNDTKLWKHALDQVGDAAAKVAGHWKVVNAAIDKAHTSVTALNSTSIKLGQALLAQGKTYEAQREFQRAWDMAQRESTLARTPEQIIKSTQEMEKVLDSLKQSGFSFGFNLDDKKIELLKQQQKFEEEIANKHIKQAEEAKGYLGASTDALMTSKNIQAALESWPDAIERAASSISGKGGLNEGLRETRNLVQQTVASLQQLAGQQKGGSFDPRQIEQYIRRENKRGTVPEATY